MALTNPTWSARARRATLATALTSVALLGACAASPKAKSASAPAVSRTELTSADATIVAMQFPSGYADLPAPRLIATPLQKQMEEEQKYPVPAVETAEEWLQRYPDAARMLSTWSREHPRGARTLASMEHEQPDHVRVLVVWALSNPYEGLDAFMMNREGWDDLKAFREHEPEAVDDILHWCRVAPKAAEELVLHSPGFGAALAPPPRR